MAMAATEPIFLQTEAQRAGRTREYGQALQRGGAEKWARPSGLRPKVRHAALRVAHLAGLNHAPRALPGALWDSNAAVAICVNRP